MFCTQRKQEFVEGFVEERNMSNDWVMITLPPQPAIAIEHIVYTQIQSTPGYVAAYDFLKEQVATAVLPSVKNKISKFSLLEENWDGYGASRLNETVAKNAYKFIDAARFCGYCPASADDVSLTPYGTIVIDYSSAIGLVSVEIGAKKIGFFTDFEDGGNHYSNGIATNFRTVPQRIK